MHPVAEVMVLVLAHAGVAWLLTWLAHSTLCLGAAWLVCGRVGSAAARAWLWRGAIFIPLISAPLHLVVHGSAEAGSSGVAIARTLSAQTTLVFAVLATWTMLAVRAAALSMAAVRKTRRQLGVRTDVADGDVAACELRRLAASLDMPTPRLTRSDLLLSPVALHDEICIPAEIFGTLPLPQQRALLAHELAHVHRRDSAWLSGAAHTAAALALHPLMRSMLRELRRATEEAADDVAVRLTRDPVALARALLSLAEIGGRTTAPAAAATGSPLVQRVERLLRMRAEVRTHELRRRVILAAATTCTLVLVVAAPGMSTNPGQVANTIPWLAPSREPPNERMLTVRHFDRAASRALRSLLR